MGEWVNRKMMQGRTVWMRSALFLFLLMVLTGCGGIRRPQEDVGTSPAVEEAYSEPAGGGAGESSACVSLPDSDPAVGRDSGLLIEFIDVGQGDSTLILCEGEAMLIDAGDELSGTNVQNEMEKLGVDRLKYFVCTHPDADHIGGADVIAYKFPVESLLMPELERDTKAYEEMEASISKGDIEVIHPEAGEEYELGGGSFLIIGPTGQYSREEPNNWSVCLRFTYGERDFLFCGDAEKEAEEDMLAAGARLDADVYHVSHHGSSGSTSEAFLQAVGPSWAVVSCGRDNDYGHPHRETKEALSAHHVRLYRTDEMGNIFCYSDGNALNWEWELDSPVLEESSVLEEPSARDYVLNTNTGKIHLPDCESVDEMKKKNRRYVQDSLKNLQGEGYTPCKNCLG